MRSAILFLYLTIALLISCNETKSAKETKTIMNPGNSTPHFSKGYAQVNGINMYYELHGKGKPLVLIHGGGSTIETSFGRIIPTLSLTRQLICVELQAHGRTGDRNTPLSFEQDADDVAALLNALKINKADIFGFSNGGNTALQMAIRHPELCNKIVAASVLLKKDGTLPQFWDFMKNGTFDQMPKEYKDAFLSVTPDSAKLLTMYHKCADRMIYFKEFTDKEIKSITSPVLLINGDRDVATPEHVVAMSKLITDCRLAIIPGGHGAYLGEITTAESSPYKQEFTIALIGNFLDEKTNSDQN